MIGALPAVVFAACHFCQGSTAASKIVLLATLFGAIAVVTRSLWIPIALHFLVRQKLVQSSRMLLGAKTRLRLLE